MQNVSQISQAESAIRRWPSGTTVTQAPPTAVAQPPRKLRVLLIITGLATGGATNVVLDIASHFSNHPDFTVDLLAGPIPPGRNDVTYLAKARGIRLIQIPSLVNQISPLTNLKAVADIRRIIVQGNYDIVHTHSSVAGIVGRLAARAAGGSAILHHVHGWGVNERMSQWVRWLYLTLERLSARLTDRLIVVSQTDIEKGLAYEIGCKAQYRLIYNGIPLEKFRQPVDQAQVRAEIGASPTSKLVGMVGRLDEQKNPLDFIRAAAAVVKQYQEVQFLLVGDGLLRSACEQLITELNLQKHFLLLGYRSDVHRLLPAFTITAMSSLWEGLPITFLESMSAGVPIVANDIDGARDVVIDGETGFLVPAHQPAQMAARLLTLLHDESLCQAMGQIARQRSDYFSIQRMAEQIEVLYKEEYYG